MKTNGKQGAKSRIVTVRVTEQMAAALNGLAEGSGEKRALVLRQALREFIARNEPVAVTRPKPRAA